MRRLLVLPVLAAALFAATPADAAPPCTDPVAGARVCYQVGYCSDLCFIDPVVDPQCTQGDPATAVCPAIDKLYVHPLKG
jgi:hypothetical protein